MVAEAIRAATMAKLEAEYTLKLTKATAYPQDKLDMSKIKVECVQTTSVRGTGEEMFSDFGLMKDGVFCFEEEDLGDQNDLTRSGGNIEVVEERPELPAHGGDA